MKEIIHVHIFAFLNFWFWEKKGSRIFFWAKTNYKFSKNIEKHHARELHKKGTILDQTPQITLFGTHPVHFVNLHLVNLKFRQLLHLGKLHLVNWCIFVIILFVIMDFYAFRRVYKIMRNFQEIKIEFCKNLLLLHYAKSVISLNYFLNLFCFTFRQLYFLPETKFSNSFCIISKRKEIENKF